jgi:hypothetical protein
VKESRRTPVLRGFTRDQTRAVSVCVKKGTARFVHSILFRRFNSLRLGTE